MEYLFRLALNRPAAHQDEQTPSISLTQNTKFQVALRKAQESESPRRLLKEAALQFVSTSEFVGWPKDLPIYDQVTTLKAEFDTLEQKKAVTHFEITKAIESVFGKKLSEVIKDIAAPIASLKDSIIAIKLLPEEHHRPIEDLTNQLRDLQVILQVGSQNEFPKDGRALRRYRRRSLMLPTKTDLHSILSTKEILKDLVKKRNEYEAKKQKDAETKLEQYKHLKTAISELTNFSGDDFQSTAQRPHAGFKIPSAMRPVQLFIQEMTKRQQLSQLDLLRRQAALGRGEGIEKGEKAAEGKNGESLSIEKLQEVASWLSKTRQLPASSPAFRPMKLSEVTFRLRSSVEEHLSSSTKQMLREHNLGIAENSLDHIVEILQNRMLELSKELDSLLGRPVQRTFKRMGNCTVMISTPMTSIWNNIVLANDFTSVGPPYPFDSRIPHSHGSVSPAGIADLLVVKQQLIRYEAMDVAHIENVLKGEHKEREHTRRRQTEELTFRETEITTSEERELESTNRFEMSQETSETIKEDASLKAGVTLSGSYGPTVQFSTSAEGSMSRSKEEATKTASKFSQDVTERSANKVTERILERSSLRVTNEVIEKNQHILDNIGGTGHISGVYQWVNKVYQAQMFNYGIRTMYDFMMPEPGVFLIAALQNAHANAMELQKPVPFTMLPSQITESTYQCWALQYGATDIETPPEFYKTKSIDWKASGGDEYSNYAHSAQIQIDEGYKAVHGTVAALSSAVWEDEFYVDVALGSRTHSFSDEIETWSTALAEEHDSIPFALATFQVADMAVAVEVKCQRTERAMQKWSLNTHSKLMQAYKTRLSEYEEKLASLEVQAGIAIRGRNPMLNMDLMKDEIKKHCITILTEQHFDLFDGIEVGNYGVPQIDLFENAAEGPYVRFFEQAFEWEQMTWLTYPYFWSRKRMWEERISFEDVDPLFNQFLKAGYCRVVVPVRPSFEGALDHFMTYGEIWDGGPLPTISNPLYLPIADEIAERLDRPGEEYPQGDPWLIRLPTTLVHLRPDDKLPQWKQDENGEWVEA